MAPSQRRGPWVPEEDQALLQLVRSQGSNNWVRISEHMKYRSPKQCRERFHQNLKPSLNHAPISAEEGAMIERMVGEMGKRWAEIARRLGNRSDNAVKNWWNGSMNRKRRGGMAAGSSRTVNGRIQSPFEKASSITAHPGDRSPFSPQRPGERSPWSVLSDVCHGSVSLSKLPTPFGSPTSQERPFGDSDTARGLRSHYDREWTTQASQRRLSFESRRNLPPIMTFPPPHRIDYPLVSPCPSEVSNRASVGPPSMISDLASTASTSPRVATSPALISGSGEFRGYSDYRRASESSLPSIAHLHSADHRYNFGLAKPADAYSDTGVRPHWDEEVATRQHSTVNSEEQRCHYTGYDDRRANQTHPSSRDSRMGLRTLLN